MAPKGSPNGRLESIPGTSRTSPFSSHIKIMQLAAFARVFWGRILRHCRKQAWLLKNSHSRSSQKFHRARMPYKRRSRFWWTFSIPRLGQFFQKRGFFNISKYADIAVSLLARRWNNELRKHIRRFRQ